MELGPETQQLGDVEVKLPVPHKRGEWETMSETEFRIVWTRKRANGSEAISSSDGGLGELLGEGSEGLRSISPFTTEPIRPPPPPQQSSALHQPDVVFEGQVKIGSICAE